MTLTIDLSNAFEFIVGQQKKEAFNQEENAGTVLPIYYAIVYHFPRDCVVL